jgi:hypothetical protein
MTTCNWQNPVSGNFNDPTKWGGGTPTTGDDALIEASGSAYTVTSTATTTVLDFDTSASATLDIASGTFTATNGTTGLGNAGEVKVESGATFNTAGTFTNPGTLLLNSKGKTDPALLQLTGAVTLTGSGKVTLSDVPLVDGLGNPVGNIIDGASGGGSLTNVNNTISGAGQIGLGDGLLTALVNEENGTINANGTHTLVIDTSNVQNNVGPGSITNGGLIEATGGTKTHAVNVLTIQNANVFNSFFDPSVGGGTTFWGTIEAASPGAAASGPAGPLGILTLLNTAVFNGAADQGLVEAINHGELDLNKATISGGTLHSDVGATIKTIAGSTNVLNNVFVSNFGTLDVTTGSKLIYRSSGVAVAAATSSGILLPPELTIPALSILEQLRTSNLKAARLCSGPATSTWVPARPSSATAPMSRCSIKTIRSREPGTSAKGSCGSKTTVRSTPTRRQNWSSTPAPTL